MKNLIIVLIMSCVAVAAVSDLNRDGIVNFGDFAILAENNLGADTFNQMMGEWLQQSDYPDISWVYVNDPGFQGYISRFETTNAQYCKFLNDALVGGFVYVSTHYVKGVAVWENKVYYDLTGTNQYGVNAKIHLVGEEFVVDTGSENHPANYMTWYGAAAFAFYYGWNLPTEPEWNAVADFDGTYIYGCGYELTVDNCNALGFVYPYGTTQVGSYGLYGYGLADMAGNVCEWTSSFLGAGPYFVGGSWDYTGDSWKCRIDTNLTTDPSGYSAYFGFRVCK